MNPQGATKSDRAARLILLVLVTVSTGIVLFNACTYDPTTQPDSRGHLANMRALAEGRMPTPKESAEFFNPPLPYVLPALAIRLTGMDARHAAKLGQLTHVLLSAGLLVLLARLAGLIFDRRPLGMVAAVLLVAMLPVYYRTFAFTRGEAWVAFFTVVALHLAFRVFVTGEATWKTTAGLGLTTGLLLLSRQWGCLVVPPLLLFAGLLALRDRVRRGALIRAAATVGFIALVTGGWFYAYLHLRFGSVTAFNRARPTRSTPRHHAPETYTDLALDRLFLDPTYLSIRGRMLPALYSDTWSDHSAYFTLYGRDSRDGAHLHVFSLARALARHPRPAWLMTDYEPMVRYAGRANLVSLYPSALFLAGFLLGLICAKRTIAGPARADETALALLWLVLAGSLAGYLWFFSQYEKGGMTYKASYMLHVYPLLALLAAAVVDRVGQRWPRLGWFLVSLLGVVLFHHLPLFFNRLDAW